MFCSNCGSENKLDAKFCSKCGESLKDTTEVAPAEPVQENKEKEKEKSRKPYILFGVLGAVLLSLIGVGVYFAAFMFTEKINVGEFNTQYFPEVSFELELSKNLAEKLQTEDIEITEDDKTSDLKEISRIDDTKYKITYITQFEDYDEKTVPFKISISDGDKKVVEGNFSFRSPKLPKWELTVDSVNSESYPQILVQFSFKEVNNSPVLTFNLDKLGIDESGVKSEPLYVDEIKDLHYEIAFETQSEERGKVDVPFNVEAVINNRSIVGKGSFVPAPLDNLELTVKQVDTYNYPKIKLYFQANDKNNDTSPKDLIKDFFYLGEFDKITGEYISRKISEVVQLNEKESLNIDLVADVSGSMSYEMLEAAKSTIIGFAKTMQFNAGDKLELLAFSDQVYSVVDFTNDKDEIARSAAGLSTSGLTCLYDALYTAVNRTVLQEGAKCIIAFTDGQDNISYNTKESVIDIAKRYQIPIFIVGVGSDVEEWSLREIAQSTGGFYRNINDLYNLREIYDSIYREQKELYVLEYTIENPDDDSTRDIILEYQANNYGGNTSYQYQPRLIFGMDNTGAGITGIDLAISNYLRGFVKAINANNFSYLQDYIEAGSELYTTQKKYVETKKVTEQLLSFEVISKDYVGTDLCDVVVRETYQIQNYDEPIHVKSFENTYTCRKQPNGNWLPINLKKLTVIGKTY